MKSFHHLLILPVRFPSSTLLMIECIPSMHISWSRECFKHEFWLSLDGNTWLLHFLVLSDDRCQFLGIPLCSDSTPDEGSNAGKWVWNNPYSLDNECSTHDTIQGKAIGVGYEGNSHMTVVDFGTYSWHFLSRFPHVLLWWCWWGDTRQERGKMFSVPNEHYYAERYYSKRLATRVPL